MKYCHQPLVSKLVNAHLFLHSLTYYVNNSYYYDIAGSAPPLDVQATQSSSSAPVEVSWSPPTDGATTVTRYRIYYGNGQSVLVPSVTAITSVSLKVDGNYVGQNVSIRSEADQLYSELLNVSIIKGKYSIVALVAYSVTCTLIGLNFLILIADNVGAAIDTAMRSCSCASEVGIAVGAVIVAVCLVVIVIIVIVVLCLWRYEYHLIVDYYYTFIIILQKEIIRFC